MTNEAHRLKYVLACSLISVILIISLVIIYQDEEVGYFRFGPNAELRVISIRIDTRERYGILLSVIAFITCLEVMISEMGEPILRYYLYDMNTTKVNDISRRAILFYGFSIYLSTSVKGIFAALIAISQFDIAFITVVIYQLVSLIPMWVLLKEKEFDVEKSRLVQ
jgi:hypothetical protein